MKVYQKDIFINFMEIGLINKNLEAIIFDTIFELFNKKGAKTSVFLLPFLLINAN